MPIPKRRRPPAMRNASIDMPKSCRIQPPATVKMSSVTRANLVESWATLSFAAPSIVPVRETKIRVAASGFTTMMIEEKLSSTKLRRSTMSDQISAGLLLALAVLREDGLSIFLETYISADFFRQQVSIVQVAGLPLQILPWRPAKLLGWSHCDRCDHGVILYSLDSVRSDRKVFRSTMLVQSHPALHSCC